jgi:DNA-binding XRE family transcriptional regulator
MSETQLNKRAYKTRTKNHHNGGPARMGKSKQEIDEIRRAALMDAKKAKTRVPNLDAGLIAKNFKFIRNDFLKISQHEMAAHLAITRQRLQQVENNGDMPWLDKFEKLSQLTGFAVEQITQTDLSTKTKENA